jgi:RimJ/RimL family protein N-acetyltransferase
MRLDALTRDNVEQVRKWRNMDLTPYRTPYHFTEEMQSKFYDDVVCNRNAPHRYFAVMDGMEFVGMVGLVDINLENRCAEISIVIDPDRRKQGVGSEALRLLLEHGFDSMNLDNIYGECYQCSPSYGFWQRIIADSYAIHAYLPNRKYHDGQYYDSVYFNFTRSNL